MPMDCPDIAMLNRLLAGGLPAEVEQRLSEHLDQCTVCRKRLERAAVSDQTLNDVARNLRGSGELTDAMKRVLVKCTSDPNIMTVGSDEESSHDEALESGFRRAAKFRVKPITLTAGSRLGNYELIEEIGRGGMGVVWKARDPQQDRIVAIKVLSSQVLSDATARQRFLREARAVGAVKHRNVVAMYGVEESPVPYLVMEFVDGPSLRTHLARKGPLDPLTVLRIALQIAKGLEASHAQGVTHRDIKPANIVLDIPTGRVKLTDFGLAHIDGDARLTHIGFVSGTPAYMSPEQAMGDPIDHRSDLFSLGSVLYAMVTGQSPFDDDRTFAGERTFAALDRVRSTEPESAQSINPEVPSSLSDLIRWLHSKDPKNRPSSAAEVARILKQQLDHLRQASPIATTAEDSQRIAFIDEKTDVTSTGGRPAPTASLTDCAIQQVVRPTRRYMFIVVGAVLCVLLLVCMNSYFRDQGFADALPSRSPPSTAVR